MQQGARCWSDSSPAVSSIWCNAYCNSHISHVVSDAPVQALFPPQPCAGRERGLHMRLINFSNLHSSSELHEMPPFTSSLECAVTLLKIFLSPLRLLGHQIHVSIPASSHLDAAAAAISSILPVLSLPSGHSKVHFASSSHMEASVLTVFSPLFRFQVEKHTGTLPHLIYSWVPFCTLPLVLLTSSFHPEKPLLSLCLKNKPPTPRPHSLKLLPDPLSDPLERVSGFSLSIWMFQVLLGLLDFSPWHNPILRST